MADANPTVFVAGHRADGLDGILVPQVQQLVLCIGTAAPVVAGMYLVEGLEDKVFTIGGKLGGYLCPQGGNQGRVNPCDAVIVGGIA